MPTFSSFSSGTHMHKGSPFPDVLLSTLLGSRCRAPPALPHTDERNVRTGGISTCDTRALPTPLPTPRVYFHRSISDSPMRDTIYLSATFYKRSSSFLSPLLATFRVRLSAPCISWHDHRYENYWPRNVICQIFISRSLLLLRETETFFKSPSVSIQALFILFLLATFDFARRASKTVISLYSRNCIFQ
jgi:hypothetical protein